MSSSRHAIQFKANLAVATGVMTRAAAESLVPLQEDFIRQFVDRLDESPKFYSETTLSVAALRYFTKPLFADTHAAISNVAETDLTTAMGWFVGNCVKNMLSTSAISCSGRRSGNIAEQPAAGGTMVPSVKRPTAPVPIDNSRPTKRPRIDHTNEEKLGTTIVTVSHSLRAPHVRVYVTENESRMVDASTKSAPATQDGGRTPLIPLHHSRTDKLELLDPVKLFVDEYAMVAENDPNVTLSDHIDYFWTVWEIDEDYDSERERLTRVIKALYS